MTSDFSKRDTSIMKGFAILCIVFHNYFHWLWPSPDENEFDFSATRITSLFQMLGDKPGNWFNLLFSYFGHYGVQIFILVSGFGLAVSMVNKPRTWESFVLVRLKKLYPLLLTGILAYFLGTVLMESELLGVYAKRELKLKLLFIHTLIPDAGLSINGPWWFFGLIFQLYLLFPLLFRWFQRWRWKAFLCVCACSYGLIFLFRYGFELDNSSFIMMNAPGHLPEFCLGIMLALQRDKRIGWGWLVLAVIVFCLGNVYALFFPFTFLALSMMAVFGYAGLKMLPIKKHWLSRPLAYFGGISMTLFAVHGFFRTPVLKLAQTTLNSPWGHFWSSLLFLLIVWAVAIAAKVFYDFLCDQLDRIQIRESKITKVIGRICQVALVLFFAYVLGYSIAQNMHKNNHPIANLQLVDSGVVNKDMEYVTLFDQVSDDNPLSFELTCAFDFSSQDTLAPLPSLIVDISRMWMKFELPTKYNTFTPQHYEISRRYQRPFNANIKGDPIKVYFWNPNKASAFKFEHVQITLSR